MLMLMLGTTPCGCIMRKTSLFARPVPHLCRPDCAPCTHGPGVLLVDSISNGHLVAELGEAVHIFHCRSCDGIVQSLLEV